MKRLSVLFPGSARPLCFAGNGGPPPLIEPQSIRPPPVPGGGSEPPSTPIWHWILFLLVFLGLVAGAWFAWKIVYGLDEDEASDRPAEERVEEQERRRGILPRSDRNEVEVETEVEDTVEGRGKMPRVLEESVETDVEEALDVGETVDVEERVEDVVEEVAEVEERVEGRGKMPRLQEEPKPDPSEVEEQRIEAEAAFERFVGKKQELMDQGVDEWGGDLYEQVLADSVEADNQLLAENFDAAKRGYEKAIAGCDELAMRTFEALDQMLAEGKAAFAATNGAVAVRKFEAALKLDANNQTANVLLPRARTLDEVAALLRSGAAREAEQQWGLALTDYQEAVQLDPASTEAVTARDRVLQVMQDAQFQQRMSEGLNALQNGDLDSAETLFEEAETMRPGTDEVKDALFQVQEARRLDRIQRLQSEARAAEGDEDWKAATLKYKQLLSLAPHLESAAEGEERNSARVRLARQMEYYLGHLELLLNEQGRSGASEILEEAAGLPAGFAQWDERVAELKSVLAAASTPLPVELTSDGLTSVDIYRVDRFQPFTRKSLTLLPGTYTVVGHRRGFKDQRLTLTVAPPGNQPVQLTIICDQPIR